MYTVALPPPHANLHGSLTPREGEEDLINCLYGNPIILVIVCSKNRRHPRRKDHNHSANLEPSLSLLLRIRALFLEEVGDSE